MGAFKFLTILLVALLATCTPIEPKWNEVRATGRHVTTGSVTRNNGRPFIRREVRDLKESYPDQWSLYIRGLRTFQAIDQRDPLSSYRILGIHGRPYEEWQDAPSLPGQRAGSYCPHDNILFATWHRPYLALYEQELQKHVRAIAMNAATDRDRWLAAADAFRIPYFDSSMGIQTELPDFFTTPYVQISGPDQGTSVVPNPLFQYEFQPIIREHFDDKFAGWNTTKRYPISADPDTPSRHELFISTFYSYRKLFRDTVTEMYQKTSYNDFATFLENFHGWFHGIVSGKDDNVSIAGHFWPLEYSSFEPMFMLHHTNVDRWLAIYQALNPDSWFESGDSRAGNSWIPAHITVTANEGLKPFWKNDQSFWNSRDVRDTGALGYVYPETQSWDYPSADDYRIAVSRYIATKYSSSKVAMLSSNGPQGAGSLSHLATNSTFTEWSVAISASTRDLPSTFQVEFILTNDASEQIVPVGLWMQLMPTGSNEDWGVHRVERKMGHSSTLDPIKNTTISLTAGLLDRIAAGYLTSLNADVVVPYLKEHLAWRVTGGDATYLQGEDLDAFDVKVLSTNAQIPDDPTQMVEYDNAVTLYSELLNDRRRLPSGSPYCRLGFC